MATETRWMFTVKHSLWSFHNGECGYLQYRKDQKSVVPGLHTQRDTHRQNLALTSKQENRQEHNNPSNGQTNNTQSFIVYTQITSKIFRIAHFHMIFMHLFLSQVLILTIDEISIRVDVSCRGTEMQMLNAQKCDAREKKGKEFPHVVPSHAAFALTARCVTS